MAGENAPYETKTELLEQIKAITKAIGDAEGIRPLQKADALRDLALAYRYVSGGPQPGSSGD